MMVLVCTALVMVCTALGGIKQAFGRIEGQEQRLVDATAWESSQRVFFFTYADKSNANLCRYRAILRAFGAELIVLGGGGTAKHDDAAAVRDKELIRAIKRYQQAWQDAHKGFGLMSKAFSMLTFLKNRTAAGHSYFLPGRQVRDQDLIVFTDGFDSIPVRGVKNFRAVYERVAGAALESAAANNFRNGPVFVGGENNCHPWPFEPFYGNKSYDVGPPVQPGTQIYDYSVGAYTEHSSNSTNRSGSSRSSWQPVQIASKKICPRTKELVRQVTPGERPVLYDLVNSGTFVGPAGAVQRMLEVWVDYYKVLDVGRDGDDQGAMYLLFLRSVQQSLSSGVGKQAGAAHANTRNGRGRESSHNVEIRVDARGEFFGQMVDCIDGSCVQRYNPPLCSRWREKSPDGRGPSLPPPYRHKQSGGAPFFLHFNGPKWIHSYMEFMGSCSNASMSYTDPDPKEPACV